MGKLFFFKKNLEYNSTNSAKKNSVIKEESSQISQEIDNGNKVSEFNIEVPGLEDSLRVNSSEEEKRKILVSKGESDFSSDSSSLPAKRDSVELDFREDNTTKKYYVEFAVNRISEVEEGEEEDSMKISRTIEIGSEGKLNLHFSDVKISKTNSPKNQKYEKNLTFSPTEEKESKIIDFCEGGIIKNTLEISETEDFSDEFYYISSLKKALEQGLEEIKKNVNEGKGFTYEYDQENNSLDPESILNNKFYNHYHHCIQSVAYLSTLGDYTEDEFLEKKVYLPPKRNKKMKTLVLDLDETLVHCSENIDQSFDILTKIKFTGGETLDCGVNFRPFAPQFLRLLSKIYEIVIFTASHSCYANSILNLLDPSNKYITFRMFRNSCLETEEKIFVKDLRIFANRKLKNIVIVDNACYSYAGQIDNGVPIVPYFEGKEDRELLELAAFLICVEGKSHILKKIIEDNKTVSSEDSDESEEGDVKHKREDILYITFLFKVDKLCKKYDEMLQGNYQNLKNVGMDEKIFGYFQGKKFKQFIEKYEDEAPLKLAEYFIRYIETFTGN